MDELRLVEAADKIAAGELAVGDHFVCLPPLWPSNPGWDEVEYIGIQDYIEDDYEFSMYRFKHINHPRQPVSGVGVWE